MHKPYTKAELRTIRARARDGYSTRWVARLVGRSEGALRWKCSVEGISFRKLRDQR